MRQHQISRRHRISRGLKLLQIQILLNHSRIRSRPDNRAHCTILKADQELYFCLGVFIPWQITFLEIATCFENSSVLLFFLFPFQHWLKSLPQRGEADCPCLQAQSIQTSVRITDQIAWAESPYSPILTTSSCASLVPREKHAGCDSTNTSEKHRTTIFSGHATGSFASTLFPAMQNS